MGSGVGERPGVSRSANHARRRLVRPLDGGGVAITEVGGKAASLDRLVGFGFPVPAAVALTGGAYRSFVDRAGLRPFLEGLRHAGPPPLDQVEQEAERVDRAFLEAPIPKLLEEAIREATAERLANGPVAVRSSATAEDLASASFAGQYRSFLEVRTTEAAVEAVRLCWASLWRSSARAYRRAAGIAEDDLAMGVVIQTMVPAEWAGVVFTVDPDGDPRRARIEAVRGLGESLVSGKVTPRDYRVDRSTFEVLGSELPWPPTFLEDLTRLALRIEHRMGAPQDVEWASVGGELFVLQARPITVVRDRPISVQGRRRVDEDGFDTEPAPGAAYTPVAIQETLPGVLPPLLWTINGPMLDEAFRTLFSELGIRPPERPGRYLALGRFRGRAALDLSVLREVSAATPGGSWEEVERQYLGRVLSERGEQGSTRGWLRRGLAGLHALPLRRRVGDEVKLFVRAVHGVIDLDVDLRALPLRNLLAYWATIRDLASRGYVSEVAAAAEAATAYRTLELTISRWVDPERAALWAQRITASPDRDAARHGRENDRPIGTTPQVTRHLGSMSVYGGPTWDEDPDLARQRLGDPASGERHPLDASPAGVPRGVPSRDPVEALLAHLRRSWKWKATRVMTGQLVDVRGRLLRKLATDASRFLLLRGQAKAALLVLGGEERRLILQASRRLSASGLLDDPDDVMLLSDTELQCALHGHEPVSGEELARRRAALASARDGAPLPEIFEGFPGQEEAPPIEGNVLRGWAAGPGRVRARARIIRHLRDGARLAAGEIIVARSTDPSWTPLFLIAGGIVLEEGGPLSHAAIVARELGLPAVLNVKGATRAITEGEVVEIDGAEGTVTRQAEKAAA